MSNSWRGPKPEPIKPLPRIGTDGTAPAADGKDARAARQPQAEPAPKKLPAAPEARKKRETARPAPRQSITLAAVTQGISRGVAWIGGITIDAATLIGERCSPLIERLRPWLTRSKEGHLPRQTVVVGFTALVVVLMLIFWLNRDGKIETPALNQPSAVADSNLEALRRIDQPALHPLHQKQVAQPSRATPTEARAAAMAAPDGQPLPQLARTAADPREKGKRYYTLATYSVNKEAYLMPLLQYLWSQGVEAAAINSHNSGFFQVVALQGFTREEINQKAHRQYEETLRRIGRKWKAEGGGDDNLQGLYLQEYIGAQAKLAITKAN
jgi:hypothetical protein